MVVISAMFVFFIMKNVHCWSREEGADDEPYTTWWDDKVVSSASSTDPFYLTPDYKDNYKTDDNPYTTWWDDYVASSASSTDLFYPTPDYEDNYKTDHPCYFFTSTTEPKKTGSTCTPTPDHKTGHAWVSIIGAGFGGLALGVVLTAHLFYCLKRTDIEKNSKAENIEMPAKEDCTQLQCTSLEQDSYYYTLDAEDRVGDLHVYENDP